MKNILILCLLFFPLIIWSQENSTWNKTFEFPKSIVKNEGQFSNRLPNENIQFVHPGFTEQIFFCNTKVFINLVQVTTHVKTDEEIRERAERKKLDFESYDEWAKFQKEGHKVEMKTDLITAEWVNANPNCEIIASEENEFTHGFLLDVNNAKSISGVKSYQKITYKNLYPNIDVEYIIHDVSGIKYSIIVHPGADISQVKLNYSHPIKPATDDSFVTATVFGNMIDHAPITFYQNSGKKIISQYILNENEISFQLGNYDSTQTIVIDPWTQTPAFVSNWDCVWECETDAAGNVYIIGGVDNMQLLKYNTAGTLQWTYNTPYDTSSWLGTMVTDNAGNTFVTQGSVAAMIRVSTAGALAWSVGNVSGQLSGEFWNIALNCNQTKLVTAGTGGGLPPQPFIYDINPANGSLISSIQVTQSSGLFNIEEVRSITATESEKYYWLTHDSIGYVSQIFNICPASTFDVKTITGYNLNYKCENWRYNNSGLEAIAYYGGFAYVNRGTILDKRDFNTGVSVGTVAIPGGGFASSQMQNSGIAIDNCGNIFVGSKLQVVKFNTSLTQLATYAVAYNVYDIAIGTGGEVIACGSTGTSATASRTGYVSSISGGACVPYAMTCCNATICNPGPVCLNDPPFALVPETAGGTWSSTAPGFNTATGVFNPAVAGVGTYTVTYTLACGSFTLNVTVNGCVSMTICREANGSLTVNGGSAVFTWTQPTHPLGCIPVIGAGCGFFDKSGVVHVWASFGTGVNIMPPAGADTVTVTDGLGATSTSFNISTLPVCSVVLPIELISFEGERNNGEEIKLHWSTQQEMNADYYTVYKSTDAFNWILAGEKSISGNSTSIQNYFMEDKNTEDAVIYYQLHQTDMDGDRKLLSTIALPLKRDNKMISDLFPNPATDALQFIYGGKDTELPLTVTLVNSLGQKTRKYIFNDIHEASLHSIETSDLPSGLYQLEFTQDHVTVFHKLIIQH